MKINEEEVLILGCHESKDNIKTAHAIGTQRFTLLKLELKDELELKAQDKIFIGKNNDYVKKIITNMNYYDLSNDEKDEVEKAIHNIVITHQNRYVDFFNEQSKEGSKLHLLEGISRKSAIKILSKKELDGDFKSFNDIEKRISGINDVEDLISKRVLYELIEQPQIKKGRPVYLFVNAKKGNIKKEKKLSNFEEDDSFFLEKLKKEGIIENFNKKLR